LYSIMYILILISQSDIAVASVSIKCPVLCVLSGPWSAKLLGTSNCPTCAFPQHFTPPFLIYMHVCQPPAAMETISILLFYSFLFYSDEIVTYFLNIFVICLILPISLFLMSKLAMKYIRLSLD